MKTYLSLFAMLVTVAALVSGCATQPAATTTTTTHTESAGSY